MDINKYNTILMSILETQTYKVIENEGQNISLTFPIFYNALYELMSEGVKFLFIVGEYVWNDIILWEGNFNPFFFQTIIIKRTNNSKIPKSIGFLIALEDDNLTDKTIMESILNPKKVRVLIR